MTSLAYLYDVPDRASGRGASKLKAVRHRGRFGGALNLLARLDAEIVRNALRRYQALAGEADSDRCDSTGAMVSHRLFP
jgi:hypothetical protein